MINIRLQMIHGLFEPLIFSFDDIFKEKSKPLILHFSLLHVVALLVTVVFRCWDHKFFMWCIVWMNNLKVKSKFRLTYRLLDRLILDYFSLHLDYGRGPLWCLKLYFIRPWFLEHQQIPSFAVGSLRNELLLKDFDCFWVVCRQFRNRITWLLIASLSSNLFLFDWSGRWRFIVHHEGWFILMRFYRS